MASSRSLQATPDGISQIQKALTTKKLSREDLGRLADNVARSTVINFCIGKRVDRKNFVHFCELLKLDWQIISGNIGKTQPKALESIDLDDLVQDLRIRVSEDIQKRCGTLRVLDMMQPIDANALYTDVNILEKVVGKTRAEIGQLMQGHSRESFDRFFLGNVRQERVDGLKAINGHNLLMILGKPGAGKTTFLKRLAMMCCLGEQFTDKVPVFVTLKEFADSPNKPDLLNFIGNAEAMGQVLSAGRGFVLLDGLDEVQETEHDRVLTAIRDFSRIYDRNCIIITCRIAAREYIFEQFTEVEVADFNQAQIKDFATKWFQRNPRQGTLFLERLETSETVKELATNPLLLTLLCLEFEEASEFPASRAELYQRGLNILLTKWDGQRGIKRDVVYKKLSAKRKESLLGQLAMHTFEQGDYFFKQGVAEQQISQYIQNLPDISIDQEALLIDSHAVLKSIESQHGLLVERATGIYSFSHLTFHEYFAAKYLAERSKSGVPSQLSAYITEKRWREVFLLITEQLEIADDLLIAMKKELDKILEKDAHLQKYLTWVKSKSSLNKTYNMPEIGAYYFCLALPSQKDNALFNLLPEEDEAGSSASNSLIHILSLSVDSALNISNKIPPSLEQAISLAITLKRYFHVNKSGIQLDKKIQALENELPNTSLEKFKQFQAWWTTNGKNWTKKLYDLMTKHLDIGHDWKFTDEQKQKLQQYYEANKLLIDCLKSECYVNRAVREEIEETLFFPISEIENWKREHQTTQPCNR